MSFDIVLQTFIATFAMLCVVGPICMTVINTTIVHGFSVGIFAGLGVSLADSVYIILASLAISSLETILASKLVVVVGLCGGTFLYYLAYRFWNMKPNLDSKQISASRLKSFLTLTALTLTGPTTIITYSVVFSSFLGKADFSATSAITGGMLATFLFYLIVVAIVSFIRKGINEKGITILNKIATIIIVALATMLMYDGLKNLFS